MEPKWLQWSKQLQALSQAGLTYSTNPFDIERYESLRQISLEIVSHYTDIDHKKIVNLFANDSGYPTPKIAVRRVVFQNNKLLLVKERCCLLL